MSPTPSFSSTGGGSERDGRLFASTDSLVIDRIECDVGLPEVGRADAGPPDAGRADMGPPDAGRAAPGRAAPGRAGAGPVGGGRNGAGEDGAPEVGRPSLWLPLIGPAVKPKEARPGPAGGAGPYLGSGGSSAARSAPGPPEPALGEPKALQLWESAMSSSSALSRNEFTAGGRR